MSHTWANIHNTIEECQKVPRGNTMWIWSIRVISPPDVCPFSVRFNDHGSRSASHWHSYINNKRRVLDKIEEEMTTNWKLLKGYCFCINGDPKEQVGASPISKDHTVVRPLLLCSPRHFTRTDVDTKGLDNHNIHQFTQAAQKLGTQ